MKQDKENIMSMIMCKYGCLSDTDEFVEFGYDEETGEFTCEPCLESEEDDSYTIFTKG